MIFPAFRLSLRAILQCALFAVGVIIGREDEGKPFPACKAALQSGPRSGPRFGRTQREIPQLHVKHRHSANVPDGGAGLVHFLSV
jgi:hypothetical protein